LPIAFVYSLWNNESPNEKAKRILLMLPNDEQDQDLKLTRSVFASCVIGFVIWALAINYLIQEKPEGEIDQVCIYVHSSTIPLANEIMCGKVVQQ